jgi:hypothetical protein
LKLGLASAAEAAGPGMKSSSYGVFSRGPSGHLDGGDSNE